MGNKTKKYSKKKAPETPKGHFKASLSDDEQGGEKGSKAEADASAAKATPRAKVFRRCLPLHHTVEFEDFVESQLASRN